MEAGNFSRIDKRAGGNKAMQVGIFQKNNSKKIKFAGKFPKLNQHAGCNKIMQAGKFLKINKNVLDVY